MTTTEAALSGVAMCCCVFKALVLETAIPLGTITSLVALEEVMDARLERVLSDLFRFCEDLYSKLYGSSGGGCSFLSVSLLGRHGRGRCEYRVHRRSVYSIIDSLQDVSSLGEEFLCRILRSSRHSTALVYPQSRVFRYGDLRHGPTPFLLRR
jgi:hypothetical protein